MVRALLALIGAGLVWLAWEAAGEILGEIFLFVTGPVRRVVGRVFRTASWPWPLLLVMLAGAGMVALGLPQLDPELPRWRNAVGLLASLGGCLLVLLSPLLWRDARRARR